MSNTNEKVFSLHNNEISATYKNHEFYLMKSELLGAFAYWAVSQSPYDTPDITKALKGFDRYLSIKFDTEDAVKKFTYKELSEYITEDVFESISEIEVLNHAKIEQKGFTPSRSRYHKTKPDYDFIDLGALARNVFYMICRTQITQPT